MQAILVRHPRAGRYSGGNVIVPSGSIVKAVYDLYIESWVIKYCGQLK